MLFIFNNFYTCVAVPLTGVQPHRYQAKILKYPQNENFMLPQLFMRIHLIFLFWGTMNFLA
ncbi:hypothetical protein COD90_29675 [Bacillus cereus]|nr:hypothetical protein COD90_29675 [Bacillus cereus]